MEAAAVVLQALRVDLPQQTFDLLRYIDGTMKNNNIVSKEAFDDRTLMKNS